VNPNRSLNRISWWPELLLGLLVLLFLAAVLFRPGVQALKDVADALRELLARTTPTVQLPVTLQLKFSDLTSGTVWAQSDEYVTLVLVTGGGDGKEPGIASYPNLQVSDLLDANGRSARYSGSAPASVLLSVPPDQRDAIVKGLGEKKALYLLPQGTATITPPETPTPTSVEDGERVQFELKVSDVASGATLFEPGAYRAQENAYVRLVIVSEKSGAEGKNESETTPYDDVQIVDLLDAGGRSVLITGATPSSILLSVPKDKFDAIIKKLQGKQAVYLLPQGTETVKTPEETPTPTATPIPVVFSLEATRIPSDLNTLSDTDRVAVILVVATIDNESKALTHKAHHYDAELLGAYDSSGERLPVEEQRTPITNPYTTANSLQISLPLTSEGGVEFAAHLADADQLYVIPLPTLTPTSTPTSTPSGGG
jgi:hypothetical protein